MNYTIERSLELKFNKGNATEEDVNEVMAALDNGKIRVAEHKKGEWQVNTWVKIAIMKYFGMNKVEKTNIGDFVFRDKIQLKQNFENVRIVPGGSSVRFGSYLANNVIMLPPSYVNIGAYVEEGTMIDSNVLVGSCAQIGAHVHLAAGVQIGGVLEPANANPVIIEDYVFVGAGVIVVEGVLVREGAVLAPGVVLSGSTKILECDKDGEVIGEYIGEVPAGAIVVPGARPRGAVMIQTPIIIGYKNDETSDKVALSQYLRDF